MAQSGTFPDDVAPAGLSQRQALHSDARPDACHDRATIMMLLGGVDGGAMDNPPTQPFPLFI